MEGSATPKIGGGGWDIHAGIVMDRQEIDESR